MAAMRATLKALPVDFFSDGYKILSIAAPVASLGYTGMKAFDVAFQDISYAWALAPLLLWALVAYARRHAYSKELEWRLADKRQKAEVVQAIQAAMGSIDQAFVRVRSDIPEKANEY